MRSVDAGTYARGVPTAQADAFCTEGLIVFLDVFLPLFLEDFVVFVDLFVFLEGVLTVLIVGREGVVVPGLATNPLRTPSACFS